MNEINEEMVEEDLDDQENDIYIHNNNKAKKKIISNYLD